MEENIREIEKQGEDIAKRLGNGVRYAGPQMYDDKLEFHVFNDDAVTDTSFDGNTFEEAKEELIKIRKQFNAPPPIF